MGYGRIVRAGNSTLFHTNCLIFDCTYRTLEKVYITRQLHEGTRPKIDPWDALYMSLYRVTRLAQCS